MSTASEALLVAGQTAPWKRMRLLTGLGVASLAGIVAYTSTFAGMMQTWLSSDTYVHGFVVLPIVAFLVWRLRPQLALLPLRPARAGLAAILALSGVWFVAARTDVSLVQQLAATAMLPATIYTIAGERIVRKLAFPLAFLVFAVPMGDELVPWLMEFTADFTIGALELSGIPVYREGLLFSTSGGSFAVEKACSGVRYLIASVAVGSLYAYLAYRSPLRRAAFMALSALVPLIANGVRAYLIVVLAHASNMQIAIGVDHLVYGWIFFGLVMLGLFAVGHLFRERDGGVEQPAENAATRSLASEPATHGGVIVLTALTVGALGLGPLADAVFARPGHADDPPVHLAAISGDWSGPQTAGAVWHPGYSGFSQRLAGRYVRPGSPGVDVAVVYYDGAEGELTSTSNRLADSVWREFDSGVTTLTLQNGERVQLQTSRLRAGPGSRIVWWVYVVDGQLTASAYLLKWRESLAKLQGRDRGAALLAASVAYQEDSAAAEVALAHFLGAHLQRLAACAGASAGQSADCAGVAAR